MNRKRVLSTATILAVTFNVACLITLLTVPPDALALDTCAEYWTLGCTGVGPYCESFGSEQFAGCVNFYCDQTPSPACCSSGALHWVTSHECNP